MEAPLWQANTYTMKEGCIWWPLAIFPSYTRRALGSQIDLWIWSCSLALVVFSSIQEARIVGERPGCPVMYWSAGVLYTGAKRMAATLSARLCRSMS